MFDPSTMPSDVPFGSIFERTQAMSHPQYAQDPVFREKVAARLALTPANADAPKPQMGSLAHRAVADSDPIRIAADQEKHKDHYDRVIDAANLASVKDLGGGATRVSVIPAPVNPLTGKPIAG